jgi:MFS family permease
MADSSSQGSSIRDIGQKRGSVRALEWSNFFLADVQAGLGPFVAAYLASIGWQAGAVGRALTFGGIVTVLLQTPAGWVVDKVAWKRSILVAGSCLLAAGAILLAFSPKVAVVYAAEGIIGLAGPFLGPTITAITMGLVGFRLFDGQFGRNQGFNAAGNLFAAALVAITGRYLGNRAIFYAAAALVLPTILSVACIQRKDIDGKLARGADGQEHTARDEDSLLQLAQDRTLVLFLVCAFLFHFANAAMLPQLGELLAHGSAAAAAPFMGACVAITQVVMLCTAPLIGRYANRHGRKRLLLLGFGVLPLRAVLYTVFQAVPGLLAVQILDGVANSIFGVVSILVIADRTRGTGRFNFAQGALATAVGSGAALSNSFGGMLMEKQGYRVSFLALGAVACLALLLLAVALPETAHNEATSDPLAQGEPTHA